MQQLAGTVESSADTAARADRLAADAAAAAAQDGSVVGSVVTTMDRIAAAWRQIADLIGGIDGSAFQTPIFALNAAVDAARAGEQAGPRLRGGRERSPGTRRRPRARSSR